MVIFCDTQLGPFELGTALVILTPQHVASRLSAPCFEQYSTYDRSSRYYIDFVSFDSILILLIFEWILENEGDLLEIML